MMSTKGIFKSSQSLASGSLARTCLSFYKRTLTTIAAPPITPKVRPVLSPAHIFLWLWPPVYDARRLSPRSPIMSFLFLCTQKTVVDLQKMKNAGEKITMVTAYTHPSAVHVDSAGIDMILVGDSVAMVELGFNTTLPVTLDQMVRTTLALTLQIEKGSMLTGYIHTCLCLVYLSNMTIYNILSSHFVSTSNHPSHNSTLEHSFITARLLPVAPPVLSLLVICPLARTRFPSRLLTTTRSASSRRAAWMPSSSRVA